MSLPTNVKLSVQGHSRPGDTSHSMPKQAMIVRMTEETLDALQASPRMEFTFGPEPGISIGGTFFAMRPSKENSPHDLYLRASSASKPMAPLKLYANITGKFTVLQTLDKIQDKMRTTTHNADRIRKESRVIMVDEPPADLSSAQPGKKRKATTSSTMFRKAIPQPRPSTSARAPSPLPPLPSAAPSPLRTAVVKALAVKERSLDELLHLSPGGDNDVEKRRRKLVELLNQIAEPGKPSSLWRLKPSSWVEVRPYEWSDLSEQERTSMARTGRLTFSNLNIPETDPVWAHVLYRKGPESAMVASGSGSKASPANRAAAKPEAPKRGLTSKEAKEKKMKPKPEISARDEAKPAPRPSNTSASKGKETDDGTSSSSRATTARKGPPGSGFRISKVPSPDTQPPPTAPSPVPSSSNQGSRGRPVDVRMKDREPPRASLPAKPVPPIAPPVQEKKAPAPRIKKTKDAGADRERERVEVTVKEPLKRKKPLQDVDDSDVLSGSVAKRRKTDGVVPASTPRDLSLPKKPETLPVTSRSAPSKAIKRESSPQSSAPRLPQKSKSEASLLPPPPRSSLPTRPVASTSSNHARAESNSSKNSRDTQRSNASSSKRRERRSPIYTSSEDEGEIRPSTRREPAPLPTPPATSVHPSNRSRGQQSSSVSRPLPTDREGLRVRYNATYRKYLASYSQLFAQQSKLESLLNNRDRDGSTVSDSDGDVEILSPEDTIKLKAEYKRWEKELESIRSMSATIERSDSKSD
ncbi:hypothetical protein C8F04DRAFT_1064714 [Mycena alexandri]|uniref:RNA polymerase II elongation factor ELL N-terminal domain-containing protein n=1 Tax=Mycena alexandri TaxID=1745969 RepID=A0AAD6THG7_9AGAR|nr:hypothetical protein C8F04DRAFT_1064714 [Mycena alexandri]